MPWTHCGRSVKDNQSCPACGTNKARWTMKLKRTRLFVLEASWPGDADAQAAVLVAAHEDGAPFCET